MQVFRGKVEVTLVSSTADVPLIIKAGTSHQGKLLEAGVSFRNGTATDEAVLFEVFRATDDGVGSSALTLQKLSDDSTTLDASGLEGFTTDPSVGDIVHDFFVSPAPGGGHIWTPPRDLIIAGGGRIGIRLTPQAITPTARVYLIYGE